MTLRNLRFAAALGALGALLAGGLVPGATVARAQSQVLPPAPLSPLSPLSPISPIETDRPDFVESSVVVPRGFWQLESGLQLSRTSGRTSLSGTESLLRIGFARTLEWRVGLPSLEGGDGQGTDRSDAYIGVKWQLGPVGAWDVSLIPGISVPIGTGALTSGAWDPELKLTVARDLVAGFDFCGMLAASWPTDNGARSAALQPALSVGHQIAPTVRLFVEWVGAFARDRESGQLAHGGVAWQPTPHLQLDLHAGRRIAGDFPESFVALGLSFRRGP